jgi:hypothetical protein
MWAGEAAALPPRHLRDGTLNGEEGFRLGRDDAAARSEETTLRYYYKRVQQAAANPLANEAE